MHRQADADAGAAAPSFVLRAGTERTGSEYQEITEDDDDDDDDAVFCHGVGVTGVESAWCLIMCAAGCWVRDLFLRGACCECDDAGGLGRRGRHSVAALSVGALPTSLHACLQGTSVCT